MDDPWEILRCAGLPDGPPRPKPTAPLAADPVRRAVMTLARRPIPSTRDLEPLLAWLQGGYHHWPQGFARLVGPAAAEYLARLEIAAGKIDRNRYLKLRRIAIENLSGVL